MSEAAMSEVRLYVLVRRDLPASVRTVQAIHAAVKWVTRHGPLLWEHDEPTVVVLGVDDETALGEWFMKLLNEHAPAIEFREPDLGRARTAVAVAYVGGPGAGLDSLPLL